jgi:hypothetical protein
MTVLYPEGESTGADGPQTYLTSDGEFVRIGSYQEVEAFIKFGAISGINTELRPHEGEDLSVSFSIADRADGLLEVAIRAAALHVLDGRGNLNDFLAKVNENAGDVIDICTPPN